MLKAIVELQNRMDNGLIGPVWPDLQSRWCMRHLGANFFYQFKNKNLMNMFKRLCD